jgi:hypothetical protein
LAARRAARNVPGARLKRRQPPPTEDRGRARSDWSQLAAATKDDANKALLETFQYPPNFADAFDELIAEYLEAVAG